MSLKLRLLLLIVGLLSAAILGLAVSLGWQARNAILLQAEADGTRIARVLAQAASVANTVPAEIEQVIGRQMVSEALLTAHLFDIAEQAGLSAEAVNARLMEITARSAITEIWGFDGSGATTYGSLPDVSLRIFPDPERSPVLSRFWHLLSGEKFSIVGPGIDRDLDGRRFKYAGVRGVGAPGAALVGYDFDFIGGIVDRVVFKNDRGYGPGYWISVILAQIVLGILASMIAMWNCASNSASSEGSRLAWAASMRA